jgi:L,D-transpeptidase YcbB
MHLINKNLMSTKPLYFLIIIFFFILSGSTPVFADDLLILTLNDRLRHRIETGRRQAKFTCRDELICGIQDLPLFYAHRNFEPAWIGKDGSFSLADSLIKAIKNAHDDGLSPADYHVASLQLLLNEIKQKQTVNEPLKPEILVDLELLLTDAFLLLGSHLLAGRVNPETIHSAWIVENPSTNLAEVLQRALKTNRIEGVLDSLRPPHPGYQALKSELRRYRKIVELGGWPNIPESWYVREGDYEAQISVLRRRLEMSGDLVPADDRSVYLFDDALEQAIRKFQTRNGLTANGKIDAKTLKVLNVPAEIRARQIELNLERWRWIPHDLGQRYIIINIADFKLSVVENDYTVLEMRVVVGRHYRRTPVFSEQMTYLVFNPYWNIPRKLALEDILPKIRRDPDYLSSRRIKVFENWLEGAKEVDPMDIDWSLINRNNFHYKFRREPGPHNDLGRVKFMFPNKFAVYLHDTPSQSLFQRIRRGFSSGCIRVEKPIELAEFLLADNPRWSRDNILKAIKSEKNQVVLLRKPIPVHILYWTAWVDYVGNVHFLDDIYKRDKPLDFALKERPPKP